MEFTQVLKQLSGNAGEITIFVTTIIGVVTIWLKSREIDVASVTTITKLQQEQLIALMDQNAKLSRDVADLRKLTNEQFELIKDLRHKILELEELLITRKIQ